MYASTKSGSEVSEVSGDISGKFNYASNFAYEFSLEKESENGNSKLYAIVNETDDTSGV